MKSQAHPPATHEEKSFYIDVMKILNDNGLPFLVAGTYAFTAYTGIVRKTKDLDLFCKAGDYPRILKTLSEHGYPSEITDERWLAKVFTPKSLWSKLMNEENNFIDFIFGSKTGLSPVNDGWFDNAIDSTIHGVQVQLIGVEEFIWSKSYRMDRDRFDGADIINVILKKGKQIDWKRLMNYMEPHWELLFAHLLMYRFAYPSERDIIPLHIMEELSARLGHQLDMPAPKDKVCRGWMLSRTQYETPIREWGFTDIT